MKRVSVNGLRRQAGVTILEFIAFIGLAALVIAGALGLYNTANTGSQSNELFQAVNGIATATRQVAAGTTPVAGVGGTVANVPVPTGWASAVAGTYTKGGNTIRLVANAANFNVVLTCAVANACTQIGTKPIGAIAGVQGASTVTWNGIAY